MSASVPPPNRSIAPAARLGGGRWVRRAKSPLLWGVGLTAVALVLYAMMPQDNQEKPKPYSEQPRATHSEYIPPAPTLPPPVIPAAIVRTPPPVVMPTAEPTAPPIVSQPPPPPAQPKLVTYSYGGGSAAMPEYMKTQLAATKQAAAPAAERQPGNVAYKPTAMEGTKSFTMRDSTRVLPPFSTINCILDTAIVTGASGVTPFRCHLEEAVSSPSDVVLMEAGTTVGGYYQSVASEGQSRVVMVTAMARTPNNVYMQLGDPVGDTLGAAGVPGSVDQHWGQRIGGALLLTAADAAVGLAMAEIQKNSQQTNISLGSGGGGGGLSNLASQLLSKTINIPPTISLNQGTRVTLWTTKVLNFSPSYQLETIR